MKFTLLAIGKIKEKWMRQGIEEYVKRLKPIAPLEIIAQVKQLDSNSQAFMELQAKTLDAVAIDQPVGMYYLKQGGDKDLKIVGTSKGANGMVFAVKKENKELQAAVNKALKEIKANGTYDKIFEKWFGKQEKK